MESKRAILKKNMSTAYCSGTRFEYLDDEERPLIYKAMQEYADKYHKHMCALAQNNPTSQEQLAAPAVVGQSEQLNCDHEWKCDTFDCYGFPVEKYCEKCGKKEAI